MKQLLLKTLKTETLPVSPLILRIAFGLIMFPHGAQLLMGLFGGYGYRSSMDFFIGMGIPGILSFLVIFLEFFGSLAILAGFFTRWFSLASLILVIGMILTVHVRFGLFMNWYGTQKGEGYEFHLLLIGLLLSLIVTGGGKFSLDGFIFTQKKLNDGK